ncbi:predicted protein [Nematostella vectensis]|uniref:Ig-like domain-containing protein n=1 Tax=Nematostella vectensis TaxID=45351 RepID=A7T348_NEMVE|nr:predicted protein [Nematostella vectensis]|eukprot:XP_001621717.1 predicted protein [Nematostella vectensis]
MVSLTTNTSFWNKKILSLQCKARGVPSPQITWYKPGGQPITAGVSPISGGSQLQVTTTQDAGDYKQYKCRASNLLGSVERLIYVTQWCRRGCYCCLFDSHRCSPGLEPDVFGLHIQNRFAKNTLLGKTHACNVEYQRFLISPTGRSKQESRIPRGALNSAAIDEDPITMNTIDLVTNTTSASSDFTYKNHGSRYDEVTATSTYQSLDRTTRTYPDGRGQERGPREYEAVGGSGPERGGEGQYAELTSTCPDYQPLHIYGNVGGAKGHRGMGTNA